MLKMLMCMWGAVLLKTSWNFLLTSSVLEEGLLLSGLSGIQFQDVVFYSSNCSYEGCISLVSGIICAFQG